MTTDDKEGQYVSISLLVSGLSLALVLIVGWLFNVIAENSKVVNERQSIAHVRSAVNETQIGSIKRRLSDLEQHEYNNRGK